jgi:hypothetical protein
MEWLKLNVVIVKRGLIPVRISQFGVAERG